MLGNSIGRHRLPLLGAAVTALLLLASAFATPALGANLVLGTTNTSNAPTTLTGATAGPELKLVNTNTSNHALLAQAGGGLGIALYGQHTTAGGSGPAIRGESASTAANAFSIYGLLSAIAPGAPSAAIRAESKSTNANGYGLWASQAGSGFGVYATSPNGTGVYGKHTGGAGSGPGVQGDSASAANAGVVGKNTGGGPGLQAIVNSNSIAPIKVNSTAKVTNLNADSLDGKDASLFQLAASPFTFSGLGTGVSVTNTGSGSLTDDPAIYAQENSVANKAYAVKAILSSSYSGTDSAAVIGTNSGSNANGYGVQGVHSGGGVGVFGSSDGTGWGVVGTATSGTAVYGNATTGDGVLGQAGDGNAVHGRISAGGSGRAGFFEGAVKVKSGALATEVGTISNGAMDQSVSGANVFQISGNPVGTEIFSFSGGVAGQTITLVCHDANTTIKDSAPVANLYLNGDFQCQLHSTLQLVTDDGAYWYEVSRSSN